MTNVNYLNRQETAAMLNCSTRSLDRMRAAGLPCYIIGRVIRFNPEQVKEWFESRTAEKARLGIKAEIVRT